MTWDVFCNHSEPLVPIVYTSRAHGNLNELIWMRALKTAREDLLRPALAPVPRAAAAPPQAPAPAMGPSSLLRYRPDSGTNHTFARDLMWLLGFCWPQVTVNLPQTDITETRFLRVYGPEGYRAWFAAQGMRSAPVSLSQLGSTWCVDAMLS